VPVWGVAVDIDNVLNYLTVSKVNLEGRRSGRESVSFTKQRVYRKLSPWTNASRRSRCLPELLSIFFSSPFPSSNIAVARLISPQEKLKLVQSRLGFDDRFCTSRASPVHTTPGRCLISSAIRKTNASDSKIILNTAVKLFPDF
jgi:hypothetical protein